MSDGSRVRKLSIGDRIIDFIARLHRKPPICGVCDERMYWIDGAWDCRNLFREDHRVESEGGFVGFTAKAQEREGE